MSALTPSCACHAALLYPSLKTENAKLRASLAEAQSELAAMAQVAEERRERAKNAERERDEAREENSHRDRQYRHLVSVSDWCGKDRDREIDELKGRIAELERENAALREALETAKSAARQFADMLPVLMAVPRVLEDWLRANPSTTPVGALDAAEGEKPGASFLSMARAAGPLESSVMAESDGDGEKEPVE